jgi:hypothetical protein
MIKALNADQARFIALLAKTARAQRDSSLRRVPENGLGGVMPGRGTHNPTEHLGLDAISVDASPTVALRQAIASLSQSARQELYTLMRVGQGHLAAKKWRRGLSEADLLGDATITATLIEDPDLHDHLSKGLYEADLST